MTDQIKIVNLEASPAVIGDIAREARASGHLFLDRLITDWHSGANRFDKSGECLLGLFVGGRLVAVGGLNRDPYDTSGRAVGRLRHVYVAQSLRRRGLGRQLVAELLARAQTFERVRLRTPGTPDAAAFYESLGFVPVDEADATNSIDRTDAVGAEFVG